MSPPTPLTFPKGILVQVPPRWCALVTASRAKSEPRINGLSSTYDRLDLLHKRDIQSCTLVVQVMATERLGSWLTAMTCWKEGLCPGSATILYFKYLGMKEGVHYVQLLDIGLPNFVGDLACHTKHGPCVPMVSRHPIQYQTGKYYSVLCPGWSDGTLHIPPPHVTTGCCRVAQDIDDVEPGWIELFCGGMGAWSSAASKLHKKVDVAVDNDPLACECYHINHGVQPFCCSVSDAIGVPHEPRQGVLASPPCPIFSNLTGAQGFGSTSSAAAGWGELLMMLRFLSPPVLLLENPISMHKRLSEVRDCRSISIWARNYDCQFLQLDRQHLWLPKGCFHTMSSFQCIIPDSLVTSELQIMEEQHNVLTDPSINGGSTRAAAWAKHQVYPGQQAPTIQRRYVANLKMKPEFLRKYGLHCPVLVSPGARFVSPWEVTRAFMFPSTTILPKEALKAWPLLGNSVSPLQCAVGLLALDKARGKVTRQAADRVLMEFGNDALQLTGTVVEVRPGWVKLVAPVPEDANEPSPLSVPTPADAMASDDSRLGQDQNPWKPSCPLPPVSPLRVLLNVSRILRNNCMRNCSVVSLARTLVRLMHHDPRLPGSNKDNLEELPANIKWKPILSTLEILASLENDDTHSSEYLNQNTPGSPNMSRPIGASSTSPMASRGADDIPEPKTPPQPPSSSGKVSGRSWFAPKTPWKSSTCMNRSLWGSSK